MLKMVAAIGCLYSEPRNEAAQTLSLKLWHSGCSELENFVSWDSQKFGTVWVVQSWLLCIVYGTFSSDEKLVSKSRHMYRFITDVRKPNSFPDRVFVHLSLLHGPRSFWTFNRFIIIHIFDEPVVS